MVLMEEGMSEHREPGTRDETTECGGERDGERGDRKKKKMEEEEEEEEEKKRERSKEQRPTFYNLFQEHKSTSLVT
ncbi:hypothetical protein H920_00432 [Fukomys damarensis]|uniref:Uncharacterized protein n=1 Tax=Fukomys damarensis TaxID=885580 RepID=A0A091E1J2_FUKDA|nr:hypothetical protein H920_00432 [Fukomys damarensis]